MKHLVLFSLIVLCSITSFSQQIEVQGMLKNGTEELKEAYLVVYSKDTIALANAFSDEHGQFQFSTALVDSFFIKVDHEAIGAYISPMMPFQQQLELQCTTTTTIEEVTIIAQKPMIEKQPGALVLNVDQFLSATGSSAFEVLGMTPGVRISATDNISLNGKDGIVVQINSKQLPMSGSDLANYLRGIPASSIEKIECLHTPSSRQDAAGTAIINIVLKKDQRLGTNGTYNGTYGQGIYPKTSHTVSINHRTKKAALFASYGYTYRKGFNDLQLDRHFYTNGIYNGSYLQKNYFSLPVQNHTARISGDFTANKNLTYGFSTTGVFSGHTRLGNNTSDVIDSTGNDVSFFETYSETKDNWLNGTMNLYVKKGMDSLGSYFSMDSDFGYFTNHSDQKFITEYLDLKLQPIAPRYVLNGNLGGSLQLFSVKADVVKNWTKLGTIEAGLKSSRVIANNNVSFYDASSGTDVLDSTKSNHYIYGEHIQSAYFTWKRNLKKFDFQGGLRAEYTAIEGEQLTTNQHNDTSYLQLFPTAFLGYNANENNQFELALGRRIDRPSYDQLNPFKFYLDPSTYKEGNPYLRPQTTYNIDFTYVLQQKYIFNANVGITSNNITEVIAPLTNEEKLTVQTNVNLKRAMLYSLTCSAPIDITKWWKMNVSLTGYYALYSGNVAQTTLQNQGSPVGDVTVLSNFVVNKGWNFEWNFSYHSKEVYAFDHIQSITFTSIAAQKKFNSGKCLLKMALTDVFFTNAIRANVAFTDYNESFVVRRDTRVATLSFTYKIGQTNIQTSKRRVGGAEDLKSRVNSGAG